VSQQTTGQSFDELARALASGTLSRGKALRLMAGLLVGGTLGSIPGVAWANDRCSQGQTRCGDRCVNLNTNERHCGSCRNRCGSKQTCCGGRCVNLQRSERHCGSCSNRCAAGEECDHGVCGGGEPICTPSCPLPCFCSTLADGTGTVCVDCSTRSCPQVSSCAECTAAGRVCFGGPGNFNCGDPCQLCAQNASFCTDDSQCCSGICNTTITGGCSPCRESDASCTSGSDCCSGNCSSSSGTCQPAAGTGPNCARCLCSDGAVIDACASVDCDSGLAQDEICGPLCATHGGEIATACFFNDAACSG
jgi:hypothetical protein